MRTPVETGTDFDVTRDDYLEYVDGDNADVADPVIKVKVVDEVTVREFPARSWSPAQVTVDGTAVWGLAGRVPQRTTLTLVNLDAANSVYLAPTRETCVAGSFSTHELKAGAQLVMQHTGEVWATCAAGQTAKVSAVGEFRDGGL